MRVVPMEKKRRWTEAEDAVLFHYVKENGERHWNAIAKATGLDRCGKSCRLRWLDHLKPNLKKGPITPQEEQLIFQLHAKMGNKWAKIAAHLPGRSDNEIKNFWNCKMKKSSRARIPLDPAPALDLPSMAKLPPYPGSPDNIPPPPLAVADQIWVPESSSQINYVSPDQDQYSSLLYNFPVPESLRHFNLVATSPAVQSCTQSLQRMGIRIPDSVISLVYSAPATPMPTIISDPSLKLDDNDLRMYMNELMALLASDPASAVPVIAPAPDPIPAPAPAPVPVIAPAPDPIPAPAPAPVPVIAPAPDPIPAPAPDPIPVIAPAPAPDPIPAPAPAPVPVIAPAISWESPLELDPSSEFELNMEFDVEETMAFLDSLGDDIIQELPSVQY